MLWMGLEVVFIKILYKPLQKRDAEKARAREVVASLSGNDQNLM